MEDLEQTKEYEMRKFFHKQTNWITPHGSAADSVLFRCCNLYTISLSRMNIVLLFCIAHTDTIHWHLKTFFEQYSTHDEVYLSAVQVQILVANLQLQNLHLVIPLFYYGGVPHRPPIQSWFNPSQDLRRNKNTSSLIYRSQHIRYPTHKYTHTHTPSHIIHLSVSVGHMMEMQGARHRGCSYNSDRPALSRILS